MTKIAIPTTTRADWGLLRPVADALVEIGIVSDIIVSGTHLVESFGCTVDEVIDSGHSIAARIPIFDEEDSTLGECRAMAHTIARFGEFFDRNRPDAIIALGDRYEMLGIAQAAFLARIPIFHIHGGEVTEGAIDDSIRHCLTKLSALHFASAEPYRNRIIQLGEDPCRVFNVGAIGVENAIRVPRMSREELFDSLGLDIAGDFIVLTYHPVTAEDGDPLEDMKIILDSLGRFNGLEVIATKANADVGGRAINDYLEMRAREDSGLHLFESLGATRYLNAVRHAKAVVGNSSSGILEAPALGTPTINIGNRQKGRIKPVSIIDCRLDCESICSSLRLLESDEFIAECLKASNPYGAGNTSRKIASIIDEAFKGGMEWGKGFFDLDFEGANLR